MMVNEEQHNISPFSFVDYITDKLSRYVHVMFCIDFTLRFYPYFEIISETYNYVYLKIRQVGVTY